MAIYDFKFAPEYAGQSATVTDSSGSEVAGSPVTLDESGSARLTLPAITDYAYIAATSNALLGLGTAHTAGVLSLADSLNAAASGGGGGGGVIVDGPVYTLEYLAGTDTIADGDSFKVEFDTLPEGVTDAGSRNYTVPDGLYMASYDIEWTQPAEDRWGYVRIAVGSDTLIVTPIPVSSAAANASGYQPSGRIPIAVSGGSVSVSVSAKSASGSGDPLTLEYAALQLQQVSSAAAESGGSFDYTGAGAPTQDPAVVGVAKTYLDTTNGALYLTILNPNGPTLEWVLIGGEIDGANSSEGVILGNGAMVVGKSLAGRQAGLTDVDAYNGSGLGVYWTGTGTDGQQGVEVRAGSGGIQYFTTDGVYYDSRTHADGAIGTKGSEPADADINPGECFRWFDSTNGAAKVMFKGKTADGTVVSASVDMA